jgi:ribosome-binding protein aMBF1 (putative translation factor)
VLPTPEFLRGWHALLFLFPGLHPDNALDHGEATEDVPTEQLGLPGFERQLDRRHTRSGWPVALELIGHEAWRRYEGGGLSDDDFYCVTAQRAGLEPQATREDLERKERARLPELRRHALRGLPDSIRTMTTETARFLRRLGQEIRSERRNLNLTQAALAKKARISTAHLSRVELGERSVSLLCLVRIARVLRNTAQRLCETMEETTRQARRRPAK